MSGELQINYPAGSTLYALLFNVNGLIWNGTAFEVVVAANWANYDLALTEVTTTQCYKGNMPAAVAGVYGYVIRKRAGGSPAVSDVAVGAGVIQWDGTAEIALNDLLTEYVTASALVNVLDGTNITEYRGTTWGQTLTGLPTLTAYNVVYLSVKESVNALDTDAVLRLSNTVGLERFNKAAPLLAANGVLTILSSTSISYSVQPAETVSAIPRVYVYDLKGVDTGGAVDLLTTGVFMVVGDVTRAIV